MDRKTIKVEKRTINGRKVKQLRKQGIIPGNIFGKNVDSQSVQLEQDVFKKVYSEVGETGLIDLSFEGNKRPVLVHSVQLDPLDGTLLHANFHQVDLKEKITARVPIELEGESSVEKQGLGTIVQYLNDVEVEALPTDLPEKFVIDTSILTEVEQTVLVKALIVDDQKILILEDSESIVAKAEPPQKEEIVETTIEETAGEEVSTETTEETKEDTSAKE